MRENVPSVEGDAFILAPDCQHVKLVTWCYAMLHGWFPSPGNLDWISSSDVVSITSWSTWCCVKWAILRFLENLTDTKHIFKTSVVNQPYLSLAILHHKWQNRSLGTSLAMLAPPTQSGSGTKRVVVVLKEYRKWCNHWLWWGNYRKWCNHWLWWGNYRKWCNHWLWWGNYRKWCNHWLWWGNKSV